MLAHRAASFFHLTRAYSFAGLISSEKLVMYVHLRSEVLFFWHVFSTLCAAYLMNSFYLCELIFPRPFLGARVCTVCVVPLVYERAASNVGSFFYGDVAVVAVFCFFIRFSASSFIFLSNCLFSQHWISRTNLCFGNFPASPHS